MYSGGQGLGVLGWSPPLPRVFQEARPAMKPETVAARGMCGQRRCGVYSANIVCFWNEGRRVEVLLVITYRLFLRA